MIVKLTQEQRDSLIGVEFLPNTYFNLDLKDIHENYIIHETEINQCNIEWLKQLPLEEYQPKEEIV
jgi:hypothetical protein